MSDDLQTVADATAAAVDMDEGPAPARAQLVVYYDTGPDARTRLIELPEGAEVVFGRSRASIVLIRTPRSWSTPAS